MKVKELIEKLKAFDENEEIYVPDNESGFFKTEFIHFDDVYLEVDTDEVSSGLFYETKYYKIEKKIIVIE